MIDVQHISLVLSIPTLVLVLQAIRMLSRIEMKVELMWDDYTERKKQDDEFRATVARRLPHRGTPS